MPAYPGGKPYHTGSRFEAMADQALIPRCWQISDMTVASQVARVIDNNVLSSNALRLNRLRSRTACHQFLCRLPSDITTHDGTAAPGTELRRRPLTRMLASIFRQMPD